MDENAKKKDERKELEANTGITLVHHSLAEYHRSRKSFNHRILAFWYMWRAFEYASKVNIEVLENETYIYILATALLAAPVWMRRNKHRAVAKAIQNILRSGPLTLEDHIRALLFVRLGEAKVQSGAKYEDAKGYFDQAVLYSSKVREGQEVELCLIQFGVGRFFALHGEDQSARSFGIENMEYALSLSTTAVHGQTRKIQSELLRVRKMAA